MTVYNDFDQAAWSKTQILVASGQSDPDGGSNAFRFTHNAATGAAYVQRGETLEVEKVYQVSLYAKGGTADWAMPSLLAVTPLNLTVSFNVTSGTAGTKNDADSSTIEDAGGGWYKVSYIFTNQADTAGLWRIYIGEADNDVSWAAAASEYIDVYNLEIAEYTGDQAPPYLAISRRTAKQMRPKQRMPKPTRGLFR